jgi:hypothetical protein
MMPPSSPLVHDLDLVEGRRVHERVCGFVRRRRHEQVASHASAWFVVVGRVEFQCECDERSPYFHHQGISAALANTTIAKQLESPYPLHCRDLTYRFNAAWVVIAQSVTRVYYCRGRLLDNDASSLTWSGC